MTNKEKALVPEAQRVGAKQGLDSTKLNWKRGEVQQPQRRYYLRSGKPSNFKNITADVLLAQHIYFTLYMKYIYDATGRKQSLNTLLNGNHAQSC